MPRASLAHSSVRELRLDGVRVARSAAAVMVAVFRPAATPLIHARRPAPASVGVNGSW